MQSAKAFAGFAERALNSTAVRPPPAAGPVRFPHASRQGSPWGVLQIPPRGNPRRR